MFNRYIHRYRMNELVNQVETRRRQLGYHGLSAREIVIREAIRLDCTHLLPPGWLIESGP